MNARAYYNENDEFAAAWLRNLIAAGHIAPGDVDERSIIDVQPDDLRGYTQCHFFAGIGGWSLALRLAGWSDDRPAWTGSCPCQPGSLAGARKGFNDERHLWPVWLRLIRKRRPSTIFGEQVAAWTEWLGLVRGDLEALAYAVGAIPIEAASAGADHLRDRYWFVANANDAGPQGWEPNGKRSDQWAARSDGMANAARSGQRGCRIPETSGQSSIATGGLRSTSDVGVSDGDGWAERQSAGPATGHGPSRCPSRQP